MSDIFISYSHRDLSFVKNVALHLQSKGLTVWYDQVMQGGELWYEEIVEQIRNCRAIILILSNASTNSEFVTFEIGIGVGLNKQIFPLDIEKIREIPSFIGHIQVAKYSNEESLQKFVRKVFDKVQKEYFWANFVGKGVSICVSVKEYSGYEAVGARTLGAALKLRNRLLYSYSSGYMAASEINIVPTRQTGGGLNPKHNWILLGGPGGFPFARGLLLKWVNYADVPKFGYRFVTENDRFEQGPQLRDRGTGSIGIELVKDQKLLAFYEVNQPTKGVDGRNYAVIYTAGFNSTEETKRIIIAPFSRAVLDSTINFLFTEHLFQSWYELVSLLPGYTQTLLTFAYNLGTEPTLLSIEDPIGFDVK